MADIATKKYYMGDDIELLPRDKLLECIDNLFDELESCRKTCRSFIELNKLMRRVRERDREREQVDKVHLFRERI